MPTPSDAAAEASRDGETLRLTGALLRAQVPALWKRLPPLDGLRTLDLRQVAAVDSAGLALLAEIADRAGIAAIDGAPAGLAELRSAYRLDATLGFGGD
jgi:phospholipid transport system transporter-binding protein